MDKNYAIFDMDGTLVDSMGYWKNLWREYLSAKGIFPVPEDMAQRIKPLTMAESAALFTEEFSLQSTPAMVAEEMNALMAEHYDKDISPKPGITEYLDALRGRGVRMCVVSATAAPLVQGCLSRLGMEGYFEFILSCEEAGLSKRTPEIYFMAAERLGASPRDTAVFEDAFYAARTAGEAGFCLIGVQDPVAARHWPEICALAQETVTDWRQYLADTEERQ